MGVGSSVQLPAGNPAAAVRSASAWRSSNTPACRHSAESAGAEAAGVVVGVGESLAAVAWEGDVGVGVGPQR